MDVRLLTSSADLLGYEEWLKGNPHTTLWQSLEWKRFQESLGRETRLYAAFEDSTIVASALVMIDRTAFGLTTWETPRGPITMVDGEWRMAEFLRRIAEDAKRDGALSVLLSPAFQIFRNPQSLPVRQAGAIRNSGRFVMPEATRILDLALTEEEILAQMKPKGRYNIHLAEKHGVEVKTCKDIDAYASLAQETARRDGFRGHGKTFYERFLTDLEGSFLLLAYPKAQKKPVAGLLGVIWGSTGVYYYGASSGASRELMAPYLLQWEAIKYCKAKGCTSYDLFGIAPEGSTGHPWAGVSDFKAKFGGTVMNYPPEQELTLRPMMKRLLTWKRKIAG